MNSKKSLLLAAGLAGYSTSVPPTELDDRWYLSGGIGYVFADNDRDLSIPGRMWMTARRHSSASARPSTTG